jgi:hypothetical protein
MPGPKATGATGTVKATAGATTGECEVVSWHGTTTGQVINVDCFSPSGAPQNNAFSLSYARGTNLMGLSSAAATANAYANQPTTASYQPGQTVPTSSSPSSGCGRRCRTLAWPPWPSPPGWPPTRPRLNGPAPPAILIDARDPFTEPGAAPSLACRIYRARPGHPTPEREQRS